MDEAFLVIFLQVHGMLSQMDPALITYCDKIAAQGGPVQVPDDLGGSIFPSTPVVQLGTTRTSARLRNVQPDVNLDQSYEALKRQKKNADATHAGMYIGNFIFSLCWCHLFFPMMWMISWNSVKLQGTYFTSWTTGAVYWYHRSILPTQPLTSCIPSRGAISVMLMDVLEARKPNFAIAHIPNQHPLQLMPFFEVFNS